MERVDHYIYLVTQNSDLTEGKGRPSPQGYFTSEHAALTAVGRLPKDMGGHTSAQIHRIPVFKHSEDWIYHSHRDGLSRSRGECIWGHRRNWLGQWDEGWLDLRDAPINDPEYAEFIRLRKKFGG